MHQKLTLISGERKPTARPTAPGPNIATDEPLLGFAAFNVAPRPSIWKALLILLIERETS